MATEITAMTDDSRIAALREKYIVRILLLVTAVTYVGTIRFDFVYDDFPQIVNNPFLRAWRYAPQYLRQLGMEADGARGRGELLPPNLSYVPKDELRTLCRPPARLASACHRIAYPGHLANVFGGEKNDRAIHNGVAGGADFRRSSHPSRSGRLGLRDDRIALCGHVPVGVFGVSEIVGGVKRPLDGSSLVLYLPWLF